MTRQELKKAMPILTAFAEGNTVQRYDHNTGKWMDEVEQLNTADLFVWPSDFRIKPEPTYRPFRDSAECWEEMKKHGPFGWIKIKNDPVHTHVEVAEVRSGCLYLSGPRSGVLFNYKEAFDVLTFADNTPFGMKEE